MTNSKYKEHYKHFSQNVDFAVRTWYHHVYLSNIASSDKRVLDALNKAPRYWQDQRYIAVQTTIIFLGKIFDNDRRVHNVDKTLKAANDQKELFSKENLRKRKLELGGEFKGIDEYIKNATELSKEHLKIISGEVKKAKNIWRNIKPLRDSIYAHNEMLSDDERKKLYERVKNGDINEILRILLNVSNALWQAEFNGSPPDPLSNNEQPIQWAKKDIEHLIGSLLHP